MSLERIYRRLGRDEFSGTAICLIVCGKHPQVGLVPNLKTAEQHLESRYGNKPNLLLHRTERCLWCPPERDLDGIVGERTLSLGYRSGGLVA